MMEACSHLAVFYATYEDKGVTVGFWRCQACHEPFRPQKDAYAFRERNYQLLQAAASILDSSVMTDCERRCDSAISRAEYLLATIEFRNAPRAPIKDSGF